MTAFVDDKTDVIQTMDIVFRTDENIVEKGENADYYHSSFSWNVSKTFHHLVVTSQYLKVKR